MGVWYGMFIFDQVYIKHAVETVAMDSNWGRVFYCNLLASLPLIPIAYAVRRRSAIAPPALPALHPART